MNAGRHGFFPCCVLVLCTAAALVGACNRRNAEKDEEAAEPKFTGDPSTHFRLMTRVEEKVIEGRKEAVTIAKEWSLEGGQNVMVEREDGRVKMSFRDGELVDYVFETRKGRRA